jgi:hypothetical protein
MHAQHAACRILLPLVGALAQLVSAELPLQPLIPRGATIPQSGDAQPRIEAPNIELSKDGALIAPQGFVARFGDRVLIGDALRYHQKNDDLYATGRVVFVLPSIRLHATRLGLHPTSEIGDAWDVEAFIEHAGRRIVISAEKVHFDRQVMKFDGVKAIAGHGGIAGIGASSARVYLREQPAKDRTGFERQVSGIEVINPIVRASGVPVVWLPYLYRDFIYDYPWTRYEGGKQRRLGYYVRAWVGTNLREIWGWHPNIQARGDMYSRTGEAWGVSGKWESEHGRGKISYYQVPHEIVMGGPDDLQNITTRDADVFDAEQQLHGLGGALYARYVTLPDADPPYLSNPARPWDERFRADYLRDDLEHRPFARRGVTGTWGTSLGTVTLDTEKRANDQQLLTDRLWGVQLMVPQTQLLGPFHVSGSAWTEQLRHENYNDEAVRTSYTTQLSAMQWFGPLGFDAGSGIDGLSYQDATYNNAELLQDEGRIVPFYSGGVRTRFIGTFADGLIHYFTPRVGVEWYDQGRGDTLNNWRFGDTREALIENRHFLTTGFDTSIFANRSLFRATATARWGLRVSDRTFQDNLGNQQLADSPLYDISGTVEGSPIASWVLTSTFRYDAQPKRFSNFDLGTSWVPNRWSAIRYNGSLIPETTTTPANWQHRPGITAIAERYRFDGNMTFRPGGNDVDEWLAQITRRMVDGDLTFTFELLRDSDGTIYDRRFGVGFSMSLGGSDAKPLSELPPPRGSTNF